MEPIKITKAGNYEIPDTVAVYDLRGFAVEKAPWGESLFGGEILAYRLGIKKGIRYPEDRSRFPAGIQTYHDLRKNEDHFVDLVKAGTETLVSLEAQYQKALLNPAKKGEGGSVHYKPVALAVMNFGVSILCDRNFKAVERFES